MPEKRGYLSVAQVPPQGTYMEAPLPQLLLVEVSSPKREGDNLCVFHSQGKTLTFVLSGSFYKAFLKQKWHEW